MERHSKAEEGGKRFWTTVFSEFPFRHKLYRIKDLFKMANGLHDAFKLNAKFRINRRNQPPKDGGSAET